MKIDIRGGKIKNPRAKLNGSRGGGGGNSFVHFGTA